MRGRPPKPTELHKLEGTLRARQVKRRAQEPKPQGDLRQPPDWLSESEREGWQYVLEHAPKGLLKKLDRSALELFVVAEDMLRLAATTQADLNARSPATPLLVRVRGAANLEISPYVDIVTRMAKVILAASDRLGFSPVARARIQVEPEKMTEPDDNKQGLAALRRFPSVIDGGKKS